MLFFLLFFAAIAAQNTIIPFANLESAPYAEWAHYHWVWLSNERANQANITNFAQEFLAHNIPVGAVDCDSEWETGFNNFIFDTTKYPNATQMVQQLHGQGIRVIFWITSMIDTDSSNYNEAIAKKYVLFHANGNPAMYNWWHGTGALLDYSNPDALAWWHSQMDGVLKTGIDGWKCDGTDPYILETPEVLSYQGSITYREYADYYYGDFFDYTQKINGPDCLIMSRPVDGVNHSPFYLAFSPRRVMFSGWTGDDDSDFGGLRSAITKFFLSAEAKYANYGTDIGGYRTDGTALGRTKESFMRWFQVCAFVPLMENGGNGQHAPWAFDEPGSTEVTDTYRKFVNVHYELVPYLLTVGIEAYETVSSVLIPVKNVTLKDKITTDFDYFLGPDFLICPMVYNDSVRNITFPGPNTTTYTSYWSSALVWRGGESIVYPCPLTTLPVFIVGGGIIPMRIVDNSSGNGYDSFPNALTLRFVRPHMDQPVVRKIREFGHGRGLIASYHLRSTGMEITSSAFVSYSQRAEEKREERRVKANKRDAQYEEIVYSIEGLCFDDISELKIVQHIDLNGTTVELPGRPFHRQSGYKRNKASRYYASSQSRYGGFYLYEHSRHFSRLVVHPLSSHNGVRLEVRHPQITQC